MGRGTSVLQAALMGRGAIGSDANPLSLLLTRPRLRPPSLCDIEARLAAAPWGRGEIERVDLLAFYHPETLREICALRRYLMGEAIISLGPALPRNSSYLPGSHSTALFGIALSNRNLAVSSYMLPYSSSGHLTGRFLLLSKNRLCSHPCPPKLYAKAD